MNPTAANGAGLLTPRAAGEGWIRVSAEALDHAIQQRQRDNAPALTRVEFSQPSLEGGGVFFDGRTQRRGDVLQLGGMPGRELLEARSRRRREILGEFEPPIAEREVRPHRPTKRAVSEVERSAQPARGVEAAPVQEEVRIHDSVASFQLDRYAARQRLARIFA